MQIEQSNACGSNNHSSNSTSPCCYSCPDEWRRNHAPNLFELSLSIVASSTSVKDVVPIRTSWTLVHNTHSSSIPLPTSFSPFPTSPQVHLSLLALFPSHFTILYYTRPLSIPPLASHTYIVLPLHLPHTYMHKHLPTPSITQPTHSIQLLQSTYPYRPHIPNTRYSIRFVSWLLTASVSLFETRPTHTRWPRRQHATYEI